jgi:hypothetical protein
VAITEALLPVTDNRPRNRCSSRLDFSQSSRNSTVLDFRNARRNPRNISAAVGAATTAQIRSRPNNLVIRFHPARAFPQRVNFRFYHAVSNV